MAERIKVDPLTRIEGHMKADYSISDNKITGSKLAGTMYRGFESFLKGRHPFDAVRITQRVCGVCHEVHGVASCMAVEDLYRIQPPFNGSLLRDIILGLSIISDHMIHFYQLMVPDYVDFSALSKTSGYFSSSAKAKFITEKELTSNFIDNYKAAINMRGNLGEALASIGAKTPFCHALLPGGVTTSITPDKLLKIRSVVHDVYNFLTKTMKSDADILLDYFPEYRYKGISYGRFISADSFLMLDEPLFKGGVFSEGVLSALDTDMIAEVNTSTFITNENLPDPEKKNAYSWIKTPQYNGQSFETGPVARAVIKKSKTYFEMCARHKTDPYVSSVATRILSRASESIEIADYVSEILNRYRLNESTINNPDLSIMLTGEGTALSVASRGMLYHKTIVKDGKIEGYNMIVPSTWNFGPGIKEPGIVEGALNGSVIDKEDSSIVAGRIVRSFDPCVACAVH
ncbi:MAG: hypothetical protein C0602_10970 [Denitrovibrio sp.]|nr:MAG: hypothetical protein C0602_10970 [Denitrovibrio sp.]